MLADETSSLTSIRGKAHTLMNHPACETLGWQFRGGLGIKPKRDGLEASVHNFRPSCQQIPPEYGWLKSWIWHIRHEVNGIRQQRIKVVPAMPIQMEIESTLLFWIDTAVSREVNPYLDGWPNFSLGSLQPRLSEINADARENSWALHQNGTNIPTQANRMN